MPMPVMAAETIRQRAPVAATIQPHSGATQIITEIGGAIIQHQSSTRWHPIHPDSRPVTP